MIFAIVAVFVILGVLAHLLYTGVALSGLRTTIREMRSPELRSPQARIRARDLDTAARWGVYGMYAVWMALSVLVVALALEHWA